MSKRPKIKLPRKVQPEECMVMEVDEDDITINDFKACLDPFHFDHYVIKDLRTGDLVGRCIGYDAATHMLRDLATHQVYAMSNAEKTLWMYERMNAEVDKRILKICVFEVYKDNFDRIRKLKEYNII